MIEISKWVNEQSEYLFGYSLDYITTTGITDPTPKFHMIDEKGRIAIISCAFWEDKQDRNMEELTEVTDNLYKSFGAVASLLIVFGTFGNDKMICAIAKGNGIEPTLHCKPVIWRRGANQSNYADFGPTVVKSWQEIKNFKF